MKLLVLLVRTKPRLLLRWSEAHFDLRELGDDDPVWNTRQVRNLACFQVLLQQEVEHIFVI